MWEKTLVKMVYKNAYANLRYGVSKYIKTDMGWDITEDPEFMSSHEIFLAMCMKLIMTGHGDAYHYPPIESEDLKSYTMVNIMRSK